jgi:hypothetical protein
MAADSGKAPLDVENPAALLETYSPKHYELRMAVELTLDGVAARLESARREPSAPLEPAAALSRRAPSSRQRWD